MTGPGERPDPGRAAARPKRFYKRVAVAPEGGMHVVMLDERRARTPSRALLGFADKDLAAAVAAEWHAQREHIDAVTMPLTRIANSAIDGVALHLEATRDDIAAYAGNDLLCYRAAAPEGLALRQSELWDPLLGWAEEAFGARLVTGEGIVPIEQPEESLERIRSALAAYDAIALAGLHVATTLTGSAIVALAVAHGRLAPQAAWAAAHVDEDWQIAQWGEDAEAAARRVARWREMTAAATILGFARKAADPA